MPEYGREYWEANQLDRRLAPTQLVELAEGHLEREDGLLLRSNRFLFTDTNAIVTLMFALDYHEDAAPRLHELARRCAHRYQTVFLCDVDIPYEDTSDRSGPVHREEFQKRLVSYLESEGIGFFRLTGSMDHRIDQVRSVLDSWSRYPAP
jgi:nicotinamide riboside kinase